MTDAFSLRQELILLICLRAAGADDTGQAKADEIIDELAVTPVQTLDDLQAKAWALLWFFGSKDLLADSLRGEGGAPNELIASIILGLLDYPSGPQSTEG